MIKTEVSGLINFNINARNSKILAIIPSSKILQQNGRLYETSEKEVIDYHYAYDYTNILRIKAFTSNTKLVEFNGAVFFHCLIENPTRDILYKWYQDEICLQETNKPSLNGLHLLQADSTI